MVAFVREHGDERALVVAPRLTLGLAQDRPPVGDCWTDTALRPDDILVKRAWKSALTGQSLALGDEGGPRLANLLADAPFGCWVSDAG